MSRTKMAGRGFLCLFFAGAVFIASQAAGAEVTLSVKDSTTRDRNMEQQTEQKKNASVTTTVEKETEACTLEIEVENPADKAADYEVMWCVIAKRTSGKNDESLVVSDAGKIMITRGSKSTGVETVHPKSFIFTVESTNRENPNMNSNTSAQTRTGDTYAGYLVLVKADGELLAQESNTSRFLKEEWIARCEKAAQTKATQSKAAQKKKK
jgi:uncharacterized protein YdbL (DUF1318 family)